ncbi:hypothetical protein MJG53_005474 [Ovis ammon polii x Ovis aries]|uniref:Uncharacterized protein n=1 Tax=Ovis ammon polii x Ovis aries TaxID=2918886 RepID=A0ACB9VCP3_9CETA|nr:hypothetical protein MJG53_005474 [Ovis ammon polii x Ovis aries]
MKLTVFALYGRNSIVRAQALEHRLVQLCRVVLHVASSWTRDQTHGPCISSPMFGFQSENGMSFREKEKGGFVLGRISLIYTVRWDDAPSEFDAGSIPSGGPGLLRSTAMEEDCERPCLRLVRRENQGSVRIMESAGISAKATAAPVSLPARQEGGKGRASGESNRYVILFTCLLLAVLGLRCCVAFGVLHPYPDCCPPFYEGKRPGS